MHLGTCSIRICFGDWEIVLRFIYENIVWFQKVNPLEEMVTSFIPPHELEKTVNEYCNGQGEWMVGVFVVIWMKIQPIRDLCFNTAK